MGTSPGDTPELGKPKFILVEVLYPVLMLICEYFFQVAGYPIRHAQIGKLFFTYIA